MAQVRLDLNSPAFLETWFSLPAPEAIRVLETLRKIGRLSWDQLYSDGGLRWEAIGSRSGPNKVRLYSLRITQKFRAVAYREGDWLRLLSLHPDHDSAYN